MCLVSVVFSVGSFAETVANRVLSRSGEPPLRTFAVIIATALLAIPARADHTRVIDGDTLEIGGRLINLYGIDAPELGQRCSLPSGGTWPCGKAAARVLDELVAGAHLDCTDQDAARGEPVTSVCLFAGLDINRQMVRDGFAWAADPTDRDYADAEKRARAQSIGVWWASTRPPWEFRAEHWDSALVTAPSSCLIKGSVGASGDQVYLAPWSPGYAPPGSSSETDARWFCSEREAIEAGWRPPAWYHR